MCRVFAEDACIRRLAVRNRRGTCPDLRCERLCISLVREPTRDASEVRITEPECAVGKSEFHRLGDGVDEIRRAVAHCTEVEGFEDVQNLRDMDAAGTRRRKSDDFIPTISSAQRLPALHFVIREISRSEDAVVRLHPVSCLGGKLTAVEPRDAILGDVAISLRQIGHVQFSIP
jgi:hypothetical protein